MEGLENQTIPYIRSATLEDAEKMLSFRSSLKEESLATLLGHINPPSLEEERKFIERFQSDPHSMLLVAEIRESIVGLLDFTSYHHPQRSHAGYFGVSVLREFRSMGVGTALIQFLIEWIKGQQQVWRLELEVLSNNSRAIQLYKRLSFDVEGHKKKAVKVGNRFLDIVLMARHLAP